MRGGEGCVEREDRVKDVNGMEEEIRVKVDRE